MLDELFLDVMYGIVWAPHSFPISKLSHWVKFRAWKMISLRQISLLNPAIFEAGRGDKSYVRENFPAVGWLAEEFVTSLPPHFEESPHGHLCRSTTQKQLKIPTLIEMRKHRSTFPKKTWELRHPPPTPRARAETKILCFSEIWGNSCVFYPSDCFRLGFVFSW